MEETQSYPCPPADYWGSEESDGSIELPMTGTQQAYPNEPNRGSDDVVVTGLTHVGYQNRYTLYVNGYIVAGGIAVAVRPLVNSGADANLVHPNFVKKWGLPTRPLPRSVHSTTIDGSPNKGGAITHRVKGKLRIEGFDVPTNFYVSDVGPLDVVLGNPWLKQVNPWID